MKQLTDRIIKFLDTYARKDEEGEYTSPDAYQLFFASECLRKGIKIERCWSEWGSGGYKPYTSIEGRKEHDSLVEKINRIINKTR